MAQYFDVHPDNPQARLIGQAAAILRHDGVIAYPTDSCYALGCLAGNKSAVERIVRIRRLNPKHNMTLVCRDLSEIANFAKLDNAAFRLIKSLTPGPYTFLLKASRDVPRRLQHPQKKTIGLRVPDNRIALALLEALGEPMVSTSLILPEREEPETDMRATEAQLGKLVDLIIDGGAGSLDSTTVIDLVSGEPQVVRQGKGDIDELLEF